MVRDCPKALRFGMLSTHRKALACSSPYCYGNGFLGISNARREHGMISTGLKNGNNLLCLVEMVQHRAV